MPSQSSIRAFLKQEPVPHTALTSAVKRKIETSDSEGLTTKCSSFARTSGIEDADEVIQLASCAPVLIVEYLLLEKMPGAWYETANKKRSVKYEAISADPHDYLDRVVQHIPDWIELNVLEMVMSMLFLSLSSSSLKEYLPGQFAEAQGLRALDEGANLRLPLSQGLNLDEDDVDPITWKDLENSKDPLKRAYYEERLQKAQAYQVQSNLLRNDNIIKTVINNEIFPSKLKLRVDRNASVVIHRNVFVVPDSARIKVKSETMRIRFELLPEGSMTGDTEGTSISRWLLTTGDQGAKRINSIADWLEGRDEDDETVPPVVSSQRTRLVIGPKVNTLEDAFLDIGHQGIEHLEG
ncbi:hypothetical protein EK21DRAFT_108312 [Setomelanomma holmii]|uniref:Uncharacterized protein n=1 Tax=Setomelanomma holmii TaxID=210430 RepID=A0A9P4LNU7_9PLEO|nr:hypothetical protein EK21DRAFT_108312 [Setomelanomma holmii]